MLARMRSLPFTISLHIFITGCGDAVGGLETTSTGITSTGEAVPTTSTSTTSTTTGSSSTTGNACDDPGSGFVQTPDVPGPVCDTFKQDCAPGQKCTPYSEGSFYWDAVKCVPVTGDRAAGESCTVEGDQYSGIDDCAAGTLCWNVDDANHGTCLALCTGCIDAPTCADPVHSVCVTADSGTVNPCFSTCEPLIQDCPDGNLCIPSNDSYLCVFDASGDNGALFAPCEFVNACDEGLACVGPGSASECDQGATGCCLPMCSLADGGRSCPGVGQVCLPIYDPPPESYEDVGYCSLMQ